MRTQPGRSAKKRLPLPWLMGGGILGLGVLGLLLFFVLRPGANPADGVPPPPAEGVAEGAKAPGTSREPQGVPPPPAEGVAKGKPTDPLPKTITNRLGMKLVLVPAGQFLMGSPPNEEDRFDNEHQHEVEITQAFYMSQYLVTKGEFAAFVNETGHPHPGQGQTDRHPVVMVDWKDALAFCYWLSKKERKAYRLPTEAEWEYSCRAGTTTAYSFGDDPGKLTAYGWYVDNAGGAPHQVGEKMPNPWGLYDMHGNVWEWCQDWWDQNYYENSPRQDPQGPSAGSSRVSRGGSFNDAPRFCRAANRSAYAPSLRYGLIGFRVVRVR